jgi:hypothetical protein
MYNLALLLCGFMLLASNSVVADSSQSQKTEEQSVISSNTTMIHPQKAPQKCFPEKLVVKKSTASIQDCFKVRVETQPDNVKAYSYGGVMPCKDFQTGDDNNVIEAYLKAGTYHLVVEKKGYETKECLIEVKKSEEYQVLGTITLNRQPKDSDSTRADATTHKGNKTDVSGDTDSHVSSEHRESASENQEQSQEQAPTVNPNNKREGVRTEEKKSEMTPKFQQPKDNDSALADATTHKSNKTDVSGDADSQVSSEHRESVSENQRQSQEQAPTVNPNKKREGVMAATDKKSNLPKDSDSHKKSSKSQNFTLSLNLMKRGGNSNTVIKIDNKTGKVSITTNCYSNVMPQTDVVRLDSHDCSFVESQDEFLFISNLERGNSYTVKIDSGEYVSLTKGKKTICYSKLMPQQEMVCLDSRDCSFEGNCCNLSKHEGITEVSIKNDEGQQHTLKFVEIAAANNAKVDIAITNADAELFYLKAQQMWQDKKLSHYSPLLPWIWRAVSKSPVKRPILPFWIQQEPMSSQKLYQALIHKGSSDSVSDEDAKLVIKKLNQWCKGKASFELPTEEQFVYLARKLYNPVKTGQLISCQDFSDINSEIFTQVKNFPVNKLLGDKWQLTKSECRPFDPDSDVTCDERTYVKKGGTHNSRDATECTPEYRAESTPDIRVPNTTFRLILIEEPKTQPKKSR